jgi:hypothetical protein
MFYTNTSEYSEVCLNFVLPSFNLRSIFKNMIKF